MDTNGRTKSLWLGTAEVPRFQPLPGDLQIDVVVIGAGITGITAALLLKRAGRKVALIESLDVLGGETGRTTAHLTQITDDRYHVLRRKFGKSGARLIAESSGAAIDRIERFIREEAISCGFERVPGYLYAETSDQAQELEEEVAAARDAGLDASLVEDLPLPFDVLSAMRVDQQAQFHPADYLRALVMQIPGDGCHVFTHTHATDVNDGAPCRVLTNRGVIRANEVFVAGHVPFNNRFFVLTKVAPYRTYAVATPIDREFPAGLFWDMYDPYHYTRRQQTAAGDFLIVGGKDHRVGEADSERAFLELEEYVADRFGINEIAYRWSGQIEEPSDGLAFIGRNSGSRHVYVATGYSGTGMTWGTLAAMIVSDAILGIENPYAKLYSATRVKPFAQAKEYVVENADFPRHLVQDRFERAEAAGVLEVPVGEGRLVDVSGKKVAVYRAETGELHALNPACTHMGCHVHWNSAEKSWDCPCHGGRYDARGEVINGPPVRRLMPVSLTDAIHESEADRAAEEPSVSAADRDEELSDT